MSEVDSTPVVPEFNFGGEEIDLTDEQLAEEMEKEKRRGFEPSNYRLKIENARFHKNKDTQDIHCAGDKDWINIAVTCASADGRSKDYFVQVPISKKVRYGEKNKLFTFGKFCEFMAAVGVAVTMPNRFKVIQKYFSNEEAIAQLNGKEIDVEMSYNGFHAERMEDDQFKVVSKKGEPLKEDGEVLTFPDFAAAKVYAASKEIKLVYCEISKLNSAVKPQGKDENWDK